MRTVYVRNVQLKHALAVAERLHSQAGYEWVDVIGEKDFKELEETVPLNGVSFSQPRKTVEKVVLSRCPITLRRTSSVDLVTQVMTKEDAQLLPNEQKDQFYSVGKMLILVIQDS